MAILIGANQISKSFGTKSLFKELSFSISSSERIGLIGANGTGKSTLLQILTDQISADEGQISRQRGLRIGYLPQVPQFQEGMSIFTAVSEKLEEGNWEQLGEVHQLISRLELLKFGDPETALVSKLSGGWKKRVALARELATAPDLLLLDEPTNHLDVESILWLEDFLTESLFATLTITHDRYFLQKVSNRIIEINPQLKDGLLSYQGDYAGFLEVKDQLIHSEQRREQVLKNTLRREIEWLRRGAKARQTKQQGRIQRAEDLKVEVSQLSSKNQVRTTNMDFQGQEKNPKRLIEAKGITKSYGENVLFRGLDLFIGPKTRLGLLGHNGCGKSTLIRTLLGDEEPDSGLVVRADNFKPLYFEQNRDSLNLNLSVLRTLCPLGEHVDYRGNRVHIRSYLDRFLFTGPQMDLPVGKLSGGEQSRLLLARLMLNEANLLILDEPTNDLDMATLNVLEECLADFNGGVVLVTHDRYFLQAVSTQILAFAPSQAPISARPTLVSFASLEQWQDWHEQMNQLGKSTTASEPEVVKQKAPKVAVKLSFKEQREFDGMEAEIKTLEKINQDLVQQLEKNSHDAKLVSDLGQQIADLEHKIQLMYNRWAELEKKVSTLQ